MENCAFRFAAACHPVLIVVVGRLGWWSTCDGQRYNKCVGKSEKRKKENQEEEEGEREIKHMDPTKTNNTTHTMFKHNLKTIITLYIAKHN